ncbi:hypothetical protein AA0Z99_07135 [Agrococcus sp. 1P02AA]|uniref:hypothetical protein n=1 Tax=Agrococcus sp. 1P02AA TaxID=3132259 RepID=UPI0039A6FAA1
MKKTRILALPAVAAVSLLALTGCFQAPPIGGTTPDTSTEDSGTETEEGTETQAPDDGASVDLTDTAWSGTDSAGNTMDLVLEADGTVLLNDWNEQNWDEPSDTWVVDGDQITIFISGIQDIQSLEYTGTAELGTMNLSGVDGNGDEGYDLTLEQG